MPELPEIETIKNGLLRSINGKNIEHAETMRDGLRYPFPEDMCEILENSKILNIRRRSKYLLIDLSKQMTWIIHLGMSGKVLIMEQEPEQLKKHDHVLVRFADGSVLIYNDARRFGLMDICLTGELSQHKLFAKLAPEPLTGDFNAQYLSDILRKKHIPIKNAIMDSHIIVGVGNIYACESLFRSRISPTRKASSLSTEQIALLIKNIKKVLQEAIASGGSTLKDYVQASGEMGYFQHRFKTYGRENEPCVDCKTIIKRIKQQGRSTFYCPSCQT